MYRHGFKSYRDLPIRMGEFGKVHRYEPSGALHGLLRVRHFTQDDAHIYCTPEQVKDECRSVVRIVLDIYSHFGFNDVRIKLSTRPENRIGTDDTWDFLEGALTQTLEAMELSFQVNQGEGAFYGPKLEFVLRDAIGRDWQCGTLQVDMNLPERFALEYVDEEGQRKSPILLHRALFGSLERFTGILLEHHEGKLPYWLAPVQAVVLSITDEHVDYAQSVGQWLSLEGLRTEVDSRKEKIGYKIRERTLQRIPFMLIVGAKERDTGSVSIRSRDGQDLGAFSLVDALDFLRRECAPPYQISQEQLLTSLQKKLRIESPDKALI
jgi:threonyl-tRNA synthetase